MTRCEWRTGEDRDVDHANPLWEAMDVVQQHITSDARLLIPHTISISPDIIVFPRSSLIDLLANHRPVNMKLGPDGKSAFGSWCRLSLLEWQRSYFSGHTMTTLSSGIEEGTCVQ